MNFKARNSNITKVLYIVLVLCIVSIMFLSIYSLFNQDPAPENGGNQDIALKNDGNDSEDAILDFFKNRETQTTTEAPKPTNPTKPKNDNIIIPPTEAPIEMTEPPKVQPETQRPTEKPADFIDPAAADAIEVLSVPSIYTKPVSGYVSRKHNPDLPEYCLVMNDYRTHMGIDIDSEVGVNVKAVSDGIVSEIYDDPLMGKTVVIDHYGGVQSVYMNLQQSLPKNIAVGESVKGGDTVGGVGETALIETGDIPHLHFEMKKDGNYIDPYEYISF